MVSQKSNTEHPIWNTGEISSQLGEEWRRRLPFMHALCGCDTTSRLNTIGKGSCIEKTVSSSSVQCHSCLTNPLMRKSKGQEKEQSFSSSVLARAVHLLMSWERKSSREKSSRGEKRKLPPTSDAAEYHSLRVYHQTQTWLGNSDDCGWKRNGKNSIPCTIDNSPAPDALPKVIRCKYKGFCDTQHCSCKKHGLYCKDFCECQASTCVDILTDEDTEHD